MAAPSSLPPAKPTPPTKPPDLVPRAMPTEVAGDPKQKHLWEVFLRWMESTGRYIDRLGTFVENGFLSGPSKHADTHRPNNITLDPLPVGTAVGLANSNLPGTANEFIRSDHQHKRDVRVAKAGVDVGTRNRLNFTGSILVTDDSVNDEIDVQVADDSALFMTIAGI